jgi:hypothetical protein
LYIPCERFKVSRLLICMVLEHWETKAPRSFQIDQKRLHLPMRTDCCIFFSFSISMIAVDELSFVGSFGDVFWDDDWR